MNLSTVEKKFLTSSLVKKKSPLCILGHKSLFCDIDNKWYGLCEQGPILCSEKGPYLGTAPQALLDVVYLDVYRILHPLVYHL